MGGSVFGKYLLFKIPFWKEGHITWRCSFCANWCVGHNLWPTKRTWERGGRAPVGHGLGNLLDRVLATMVGPVHATITSSIAQWWNRCVISGKRWLHYHWHSSIAYMPRTQYLVQHHGGASMVQMVHYHWHSAMVWGGPALSMVQIHGTHTTPGTAPWWGQRGTDGTVPLTQQHHGGGGGEKAGRLHCSLHRLGGPTNPTST